MSADEPEAFSLGLARSHSWRTMATVLGRAPSTVRLEDEQEERGQEEREMLRSDKQLGDKGTSQGRQRMPPQANATQAYPIWALTTSTSRLATSRI